MNAVADIRQCAEKVFKYSGHEPVVVLVGYELYEEVMGTVANAVRYARSQSDYVISRGKESDKMASQYFGFTIRFVEWHGGIAALPRQLLQHPFSCFGIEW